MKRAVTMWQFVVFLLLLSAVISTYVVLAVAWERTRVQQDGARPPVSIPQPAVQLLSPRQDALYRLGDPIPIAVAITTQDYLQVELLVDGRAVAASTNVQPESEPRLVEFSWAGSTEGVYVLSAQAREAEGTWVASDPVTVTIVPAGHLLFSSNRDGSYAIYDMPSHGRQPVRRTTGPGDARQPCVLSDGTLVYAADAGNANPLIVLGLAHGELAPIVAGIDPACPADGGILAYAAGVEGTSQVLTVNAWGGVPRTVTAEAAYAGQPAWSPDGSQIAYVADRDGNWDIWVVRVASGQVRRLTDDPALDWAPTWSPDGTRIAFVSDRDGTHQVYTIQPDGTRVKRVTDLPGGAESPAWSPEGFWLAFVGYGGFGVGVNARELYLGRADGGYLVRLTHNRSDDTDVTWAPER